MPRDIFRIGNPMRRGRRSIHVDGGFEVFYRGEAGSVLRLCFLATLNREAAADATQEAMARAWKYWAEISAPNPRAWVRTVALNLCRSRWRQIAREARLLPRMYTLDEAPAVFPNHELYAALRRLPPRQREAIALHYFADLPIAECARTMSLSVGAVKSHLARGRERLGSDASIKEEQV
jgi:RNA polymerase sigma-70 factor, ECF subfamily